VELAKRLVEEKAEQLVVSSKYKSEFFSNMSHELRTPLNSLLILAGELKDNPEENLTDAQVQFASVIHSSGTDLLRLLNDILDLAKVESGTVTLEVSQLPLAELLSALEHDFAQVAEQQGMTFSVEISPDVPASINTDAGRLRQVLKNLLSNAFKFTDHGGVTLRVNQARGGWTVGHERLDTADSVTSFSVSDTGMGITSEMQQRIFEAFAQGDGTTARPYGGTGLGLSISRELVRLLDGEIALSSTPGQGSTFTVYLPSTPAWEGGAGPDPVPETDIRPPSPSPSPSPSPQGPARTDLAGLKALVVDDDFRNIFALTALLERGNFEVISAESGQEGVATLKRTPDVDIVLMDIMMPVMDGYATMRAMRKLPRTGDLPIVAVTANVSAGERQRCIDAGASAYIPKPVDTTELLLLLSEWLPGATRTGLDGADSN
jgi:CheY-like chemotaxis protein